MRKPGRKVIQELAEWAQRAVDNCQRQGEWVKESEGAHSKEEIEYE